MIDQESDDSLGKVAGLLALAIPAAGILRGPASELFWKYAPKLAEHLQASPHVVDAKYSALLDMAGLAGGTTPRLQGIGGAFPKESIEIKFPNSYRHASTLIEKHADRLSPDSLAYHSGVMKEIPATVWHEGLHAAYNLQDPNLPEIAKIGEQLSNYRQVSKKRLKIAEGSGFPPQEFHEQMRPLADPEQFVTNYQRNKDIPRARGEAIIEGMAQNAKVRQPFKPAIRGGSDKSFRYEDAYGNVYTSEKEFDDYVRQNLLSAGWPVNDEQYFRIMKEELLKKNKAK